MSVLVNFAIFPTDIGTSVSSEVSKIIEVIKSVPGVRDTHDLRTRRIGGTGAIDVHVCVDPELTVVASHDIATSIESRLQEALNKEIFISIHIEPFGYE